MTQEEIILDAATSIANTVTSMHFHNQGLLDDQVSDYDWWNYSEKVRNAVLDSISRFEN